MASIRIRSSFTHGASVRDRGRTHRHSRPCKGTALARKGTALAPKPREPESANGASELNTVIPGSSGRTTADSSPNKVGDPSVTGLLHSHRMSSIANSARTLKSSSGLFCTVFRLPNSSHRHRRILLLRLPITSLALYPTDRTRVESTVTIALRWSPWPRATAISHKAFSLPLSTRLSRARGAASAAFSTRKQIVRADFCRI
mmetsp:Transcript_12405/g.31128  ORF Transcript_12405/g.31128 Transcript_12405/m.31128 type:complete len:202 (-) Transcript_12405:3583-4188(-)